MRAPLSCLMLHVVCSDVILNAKANAMNASATIFEVLSDIDSKFAKYSNKECDGISAEVQKWFKKLSVREICVTSVSGRLIHPM